MHRTLGISLGIVVIALASSAFADIQASWSTSAMAHKGAVGQTFTYVCPGNGTTTKAIYGTDLYTLDSGVCVAAVHAGLITVANGGSVAIKIEAGQASYASTERNGVKSSSWGSYDASFSFVTGAKAITWTTTVADQQGKVGTVLELSCPPNGSLGKAIYGTDAYTIDSAVCVAAVHAGKITQAQGGTVKVEIAQGMPKYVGTPKNGVTSNSWGSYHTSFLFK